MQHTDFEKVNSNDAAFSTKNRSFLSLEGYGLEYLLNIHFVELDSSIDGKSGN